LKTFFSFIFVTLFTLLVNAQTQLTVRGFTEGYYRHTTGKMVAVIDPVNFPDICDTGIIRLLDTANYQSVFFQSVLINTDGYGTCTVPNSIIGRYYFISLIFRNTLHVYGACPMLIDGQSMTVDLTNPLIAFSNVDTAFGVAKAYSGDVANANLGPGHQDGIMESQDLSDMEDHVFLHDTGYVVCDLTGDRVVDTLDLIIEVRNVYYTLVDLRPYNCVHSGIGIIETGTPSVKIFPNPCLNYFQIHLDNNFRNFSFRLFNDLGEICKSGVFVNVYDVRIDCGDIPSGIYRLVLTSDNFVLGGSVVVLNKE
jgi:hypothetical protein